jgi:transcriptional antiterminator NusG
MSPEDEPETDPDLDSDEEGEPSLADDLADQMEGEPSLADDLEAESGEGPGLADDLEGAPGEGAEPPQEGAPLSEDLDVDDADDPLDADVDAEAEDPLDAGVDTEAGEAADPGDAPLAGDLEGGGASPNIDVETEDVETEDEEAEAIDVAGTEGETLDATEPEEEEDELDPDNWPNIYALKTTINQEKTVMKMVKNKTEKAGVPVMAILAPSDLRGYILIESTDRPGLERVTRNIPHARGLVDGETELAEVEHFLTPKPAVAGIAEGDIVELTSGPFKGERARVQRIDEGNEEITVELFEAMVPIPVTVRGDHVRVLEKEEESDR